MVFDFKKGHNPGLYADLMATAILKDPMLGFGPDTLLLTIPASTPEKHERRFKRFSQMLAENLGVIDCFNLLKVSENRKPEGQPPKSLSDTIQIDDPERLLQGRNILLADDLYAKGGSFGRMCRILMAAGAKSVTGVFLAKSIRDGE